MTHKEKKQLRERLTTKCEAFFFKQSWFSEPLKSSSEVFNWIKCNLNITDIDWKESFYCLYLNRNNRILAYDKISSGGITGTVVDLKVILFQAIMCQSCAILLCHNHPSGNLQPSEHDKSITKKIIDAAKILDLIVLDHIILADGKYLSFADEGFL